MRGSCCSSSETCSRFSFGARSTAGPRAPSTTCTLDADETLDALDNPGGLRMRTRLALAALFAALFALAASASAQDFGVMESAETIDRGNFKLRAHPMLILGEDGADSELGVVLVAGYGIADRLDAEAKVAAYSNLKFIGVDAEYWLLKGGLDVSLSLGGHIGM